MSIGIYCITEEALEVIRASERRAPRRAAV